MKYIPAMAALLSLAACQSEDVQPDGFLTNPNAVRIAAGAGNLATRSNPTSGNSAEVTAFNTGDRIAVSTDDGQKAVYTLDADGQTWTPQGSNYLLWNNPQHTFTAYYPSGYTGTETVPGNQSTLENIAAADYMTFTGTFAKQDRITLFMERQTARVVIKKDFVWKNQYLNGTAPTHTVTSLTLEGTKDNTTLTLIPYKQPDGDYYILLDPTFTNVSVSIGVTPNDGGTGGDVLTVPSLPTLEAGRSYTYTLTLGKDKATLGNVTVEDWTTESLLGEGVEGVTEKVDKGYTTSTANGVTTYTVNTAEGLQAVNALVLNDRYANITLAADITLPAPVDGGSNWTAISGYYGTFDGNGKTITGLTIQPSSSGYEGLTSSLPGTIKNLTLTDCKISGGSYTGAFAGVNYGTISGCTLKGTSSISGNGGQYIGGIAGHNSGGTIVGCTVSGSVTIDGDEAIGGIVGRSRGNVTACLVQEANIRGNSRFGGVVGYNDATGSITGCYAYATPFSGDANIVGDNSGGTTTQCYYTTDGSTFGHVGGSAQTTWSGVMSAMNNAISGWEWGGDKADSPTLTQK